MAYLHANNVIHRGLAIYYLIIIIIIIKLDIKGANVLVDNNGSCKLADFGSSKKIIYGCDGNEDKYNSLRGTAK